MPGITWLSLICSIFSSLDILAQSCNHFCSFACLSIFCFSHLTPFSSIYWVTHFIISHLFSSILSFIFLSFFSWSFFSISPCFVFFSASSVFLLCSFSFLSSFLDSSSLFILSSVSSNYFSSHSLSLTSLGYALFLYAFLHFFQMFILASLSSCLLIVVSLVVDAFYHVLGVLSNFL